MGHGGFHAGGGGGTEGFVRNEAGRIECEVETVDAGAAHWKTGWGGKDKLGHGYREDEGLLGVKWHNLYLRDLCSW